MPIVQVAQRRELYISQLKSAYAQPGGQPHGLALGMHIKDFLKQNAENEIVLDSARAKRPP